jgi:Tol biopolymer transport system component
MTPSWSDPEARSLSSRVEVLMKRALLIACGALLVVATGHAGQDPKVDAERLLKAAQNTETVDGNPQAAIKQYQALVDRFSKSDRATAATALLRMAECYQKVGDAQAIRTYERLIRDYADQNGPVSVARSRLGTRGSAAEETRGDRAVWSGERVRSWGRVSPDGRFMTGQALSGGLSLHDIQTNTDRTLTPEPESYFAQWTRHSVFSKDGRQVVYEWNQNSRLAFRIADVVPSGFVQPRQFFLASDEVVPGGLECFDWSPDGKWIAAVVRRKDQSGQILRISVADGSAGVLQSMDWNVPTQVFFSRDSKYIAFDRPATPESTEQRDIFLLAIDGSREVPAVRDSAHKGVMGFSPDGTKLLFSSDKTGSMSLWALPYADGRMIGPAELLKSDIGKSFEGRTHSLGVTDAGALFEHKRISNRDVAIAAIDLDSGKVVGAPATFAQGFAGSARNPMWSPDGKYLAYPCDDGTRFAIRTVQTGQVRVLPRRLNYIQAILQWVSNGQSVLVRAHNLKGRVGLFSIDLQSGEPTEIPTPEGFPEYFGFAQLSPDGHNLYLTTPAAIVERDIASGEQREILRAGPPAMGPISPDGRYLAVVQPNGSRVGIVSVAGGDPTFVLQFSEPEHLQSRRSGREVWTPDSKALIVLKEIGRHGEAWLVPIDGRPPRKLDMDVDSFWAGAVSPEETGISLSPDGRRFAVVLGRASDEVWALENFLPAATTGR